MSIAKVYRWGDTILATKARELSIDMTDDRLKFNYFNMNGLYYIIIDTHRATGVSRRQVQNINNFVKNLQVYKSYE